MNLHKATKAELKTIKKLYISAFPRIERAPFFFIKRRAAQNRATMLVAEEGGEFVGFAYTIGHGDLIYLFLLAVAKDKRGKGNGSEFLRLLKDYLNGKRIFLAREPLDDSAKNSLERIKRRSFYIKNGFIDMPFQIKEAGVVYDIMTAGDAIAPSDYDALIKSWAGKLVFGLVKMESLKQSKA